MRQCEHLEVQIWREETVINGRPCSTTYAQSYSARGSERVNLWTDANDGERIAWHHTFSSLLNRYGATGWEPAIPLERTLSDTLAWWREEIRAGRADERVHE